MVTRRTVEYRVTALFILCAIIHSFINYLFQSICIHNMKLEVINSPFVTWILNYTIADYRLNVLLSIGFFYHFLSPVKLHFKLYTCSGCSIYALPQKHVEYIYSSSTIFQESIIYFDVIIMVLCSQPIYYIEKFYEISFPYSNRRFIIVMQFPQRKYHLIVFYCCTKY